MPPVKTRQGYQKHEPYPLNEFPRTIIVGIAQRLVHLMAVGHADLDGDVFAQMFADTIDGQAYGKPLGIADVAWNGCGWSVKTIKNAHPHRFTVNKGTKPKMLRLISGRNSPDYAAGISDPRANLQLTGNTVLEIYNSRIAEAREQHDDVRLVVLVRNMSARQFTIFERPITPIPVNDYVWKQSAQGTLEGFEDGCHVFTWQPSGGQFTIKECLPKSATRFTITNHPALIKMEHVLRLVRFKDDWVEVF